MNLYKIKLLLSKIYRKLKPIRGRNNTIENYAKTNQLSFNMSGDYNQVKLSKKVVLNNVSIYLK